MLTHQIQNYSAVDITSRFARSHLKISQINLSHLLKGSAQTIARKMFCAKAPGRRNNSVFELYVASGLLSMEAHRCPASSHTRNMTRWQLPVVSRSKD